MVINKNKLVKITPNIITQVCEYLDINLYGLSVKTKIDLKIIKKINNGDAVKIDTMRRLHVRISKENFSFNDFLKIDFQNISKDNFNINEKISIDGEGSNQDIQLLRIKDIYDLSLGAPEGLFDSSLDAWIHGNLEFKDIQFNETIKFSLDFTPDAKEKEKIKEFDFSLRDAIINGNMGNKRSISGSSIEQILSSKDLESNLQIRLDKLANDHFIYIYMGNYLYYRHELWNNISEDNEIIILDVDPHNILDENLNNNSLTVSGNSGVINQFIYEERKILHISKQQEENIVASVDAGECLVYYDFSKNFSYGPMPSNCLSYFELKKSMDPIISKDIDRTYFKLMDNWFYGDLDKRMPEFSEDLGFALQNTDNYFRRRIGFLIDYKKKYGDYKTVDGDTSLLGRWVTDTRSYYKSGVLSQKKVNILNDLGFIWDPIEEEFNRAVEYLIAYKEGHGDSNVYLRYITSDGFNLGRWVSIQRKSFRIGTLSEEKIKILSDLGFIWDPSEEVFNRGVEYLIAYKEGHGDCNVTHRYKTSDGFNLGRWVAFQRKSFRNGTLSEEKIKILSDLGFIWDPFEEAFIRGVGYLIAYKDEYGDCCVPYTHKTSDGFNLGTWISSQRMSFKKKTLSLDKTEILNNLGFIEDLSTE